MHKQTLIALIVLIVGGIATYVLISTNPSTQAQEQPTKLTTNSPSPFPEVYEWKFAESPADTEGTPQTLVSVVANGKVFEIGTFAGSCHEVITGETGIFGEHADTNETSRVQCWFAGGGNEIGIFHDGAKVVIKKGELGEGSEETPSFRGNFQAILEI